MSLSRKKEDKVNNTGRFHLMKNRYGMDGLLLVLKQILLLDILSVKNEYVEGEELKP